LLHQITAKLPMALSPPAMELARLRPSLRLPESRAGQCLHCLRENCRGALSSSLPAYQAHLKWIALGGIFTSALQPRKFRAGHEAKRHALASTGVSSDVVAPSSDRPALRFGVGARVFCNVGDWELGTVIRHWYHEPGQPEEEIAPYQIKLDKGGTTIFAPLDDDRCVFAALGIDAYGKIPVTILTGFLGAGKTTLLNYILREQHGKRYAVIENEVGNVAIDEMLLDDNVGKQSTMESIHVLDNGCLCCTLRDDLVGAIADIIDTVKKRIDDGVPDAMIDGILIETTGIADPGPVCKTFDLNPLMKRHCKIDGVLTVVDSVHFLTQLRRERPDGAVNEPAQQVAFADKVLLNKVDAVDAMKIEETLEVIRSINSIVPIKKCSIGKRPNELPLDELIAIDSFDATRLLTQEVEGSLLPQKRPDQATSSCSNSGCKKKSCSDPDCEATSQTQDNVTQEATSTSTCGNTKCKRKDCSDPDCKTGPQLEKHTDIGTMLLEMEDAPLDGRRFSAFLQKILKERSIDLYRYKGILAVRQRDLIVRYVLQGVHDMSEITFSSEWPAERPVKSQVVIIGRDLDTKSWKQAFAECVDTGDGQAVRLGS